MDFYPGGTLDKVLSNDTPITVIRRRLTELANAFAYVPFSSPFVVQWEII